MPKYPAPVVTGISPKEGPPGTRVTIRGEHLGSRPMDLLGLTICSVDCLLWAEWKSPNKIIARSGPCKGRGDIIVQTVSGGEGTSLVQFRGYYETIGPLKESAVWVEEAPMQNLLWSRRSMSPSSSQQEDPLGLSVEDNDKKIPEDDLHEMFPDASGDLMADNFSPAWFLVENHHATSFNDLKAGYAFIRRKVDSQRMSQLSFLKKNVGFVMDQLDTLLSLRDKHEKALKSSGPDITTRAKHEIEESIALTKALYEDVLTRRDKADHTRMALALLTRFRFLFAMPCVIETNIKKGDYDLVINDYIRVKNLFGKTNVKIFRKILDETDTRILELRETLLERLRAPPFDVDQQKRLVASLSNLDANNDFGWDCVRVHVAHLEARLNELSVAFGKAKVDVAGTKCKSKSDEDAPVPVIYIENATELMCEYFPGLWRIGRSYFSGELNPNVDVTLRSAFKDMVLSVFELFIKLTRDVLLPGNSLRPNAQTMTMSSWLPYCLRQLLTMYKALKKLDLPHDAMLKITELMTHVEIFTMTSLFRQTLEDMKTFYKMETWKLRYVNDHGGVTDLPFKFEKTIAMASQVIRESVLNAESNLTQLVNCVAFVQEYEHSIDQLLTEMSKTYKKLAFSGDQAPEPLATNVSTVLGNATLGTLANGSTYVTKTNQPSFERRLLIVMSNCQYTVNYSLNCISTNLQKLNYPAPVLAIASAQKSLSSLSSLLIETYLEQKCDPLIGTIEPSMYVGRFDWDTPYPPQDVSPYAKEVLNNLIVVYNEVQEVSQKLVEKLLSVIIETVAEEIARLMHTFRKFSDYGSIQAHVDIYALKQILQPYSTTVAESRFDEATGILPKLTQQQMQTVELILTEAKGKMTLISSCFRR